MFFVKSNAFKSYYIIYMVRELTNPLTNRAPRQDAGRVPQGYYSAFKGHLSIAPL